MVASSIMFEIICLINIPPNSQYDNRDEKTFKDRGSGCINPNQITSMIVSSIMFEILCLIIHNINK